MRDTEAAASTSLFHAGINFGTFDLIKGHFEKAASKTRKQRPGMPFLNAFELFLAGALAKVVATVFTYPLIRAKVKMMSAREEVQDDKADAQQMFAAIDKNCNGILSHTELKNYLKGQSWAQQILSGDGFHWQELFAELDLDKDGHIDLEEFITFYRDNIQALVSARVVQQNVIGVMLATVREQGLRGSFQGCREQIVLTVTKQALVLTNKEYINAFVSYLFASVAKVKQ